MNMNAQYQNALDHFKISGWPKLDSATGLVWSPVHRSDTDCRISIVALITIEFLRVYEVEVGAAYPKADGRWHWSGDWGASGSEDNAYQAATAMHASLLQHLSLRKWPT